MCSVLGVPVGQITGVVGHNAVQTSKVSNLISRYSPPPPADPADGDRLQSTNWENSALFLVSCFQYILVAAVFSIGPPFRKPMWSNGNLIFIFLAVITMLIEALTGWLMFSLIVLTMLNLMVLLGPPQAASVILQLMRIPFSGRTALLWAVCLNVVLSLAFERWGVEVAARVVGVFLKFYRDRRRIRGGKAYKLVENAGR